MSGARVGSLCSGYGGLEQAVQAVIPDAELAWVSDIDKGARKVLAHRYPDVPNLGDMTTVDWAAVEPVDILTGGTPCQDLSHAGKRAGMTAGTRSNLWVSMREAIATIRPALVVWENVGGAYSARADSDVEQRERLLGGGAGRLALRALGRVLGDLASLGYDAQWHGLRAADVGAPHGRLRVFVAAYPKGHARRLIDEDGSTTAVAPDLGHERSGRAWRGWDGPADSGLLPTPRATDGTKGGPNQRGSSGDLMLPSAVTHLLPTPTTADHKASGSAGYGGNEFCTLTDATVRKPQDWGDYASAIARWEALTRPAPAPTQPSKKGTPQLSAAFSEWMMGLPAGWITDVPGITRNEALKLAGNGVVPQQAAAALRIMLARAEVAA